MKWCRVSVEDRAVFGILEGDEVVPVEGSPFGTSRPTPGRYSLSGVKILVPVLPANFYAVGVNYRAHVEWARMHHGLAVEIPGQPDIGYRSVNALIPTGAPIIIPGDSPGPVEYEGELVAVVGRTARHLSEGEALSCLLGYTLGNDVSERAWQRSDRTLWRAKNTDTFKPMGPVIATDLDPMTQHIVVRINGKIVNEYETGSMLFTLQQYISRMTRYLTLYPGDVIWLGTDGATEPALTPGDVVEIEDEAIGVLRNPVVRER
ncbi:MAG: fumarylacetoacetate hydrolase family protein [Candidatus Rokubacteria bacterium]|nr:fumarylacetoacetate hydrolase family protein [Candidatus Rokubacteria bacterium]